MLPAIYKNRCPNCGGDISSENLEKGFFCEKCQSLGKKKDFCDNLDNYKNFCIAEKKLQEFNSFFKEKIGYELSSLQKMWAKRFFLDSSFALLAPTGIWKSTFGLLLAGFVKNAYILLPTKLLVQQAQEKLQNWWINALAYTWKKSQKEQIASWNYDILITTTQFYYKNADLINKKFSLVFVDDVDSILKSWRKIDLIFKLIFPENILQQALEYFQAKDWENLKKLSVYKMWNLLVSSATATPRTKKILLFKFLLGFEVAKPNLGLRNIEDTFDEKFSYENALNWLRKLGKWGLIFLPADKKLEGVKDFIKFLAKNWVKAYSYEEFFQHLEEFKQGKCYFVGLSTYKNPLARGIDLPEHIRYTLFVWVPKMIFSVKEFTPKTAYFVLLSVFPYLVKEKNFDIIEEKKWQNNLYYLKNYAFLPNPNEKISQKLEQITQEVKSLLEKYADLIKNSPEISFDGENFIIADIVGYLQASGRASRFYKGHLTKGLSLVLVDNKKAFYNLNKKLRWFTQSEFKPIENLDLEKILEEIDKTRQSEYKSQFKTSFVVVESPTKAKTISSFFWTPIKRIIDDVAVYEVLTEDRLLVLAASVGHDFDLVENEGFFGVLKKYIPIFRVLENKDKILQALNLESAEVEEVLLATDPDREWEKISFDLYLNNKIFAKNISRIEFHEITKKAFENALANPRNVDLNLVSSQFVRRIADRWVGFIISHYLQNLLNNPKLSAWRVQTPVLKWICQRTEKLHEKIYVVSIQLKNWPKIEFEFEDKAQAEEFVANLPEKIQVKKHLEATQKLKFPPYTTSELLKDASSKLKFSPQITMQLAQELFENGFITYHRTDSTRLSPVGLSLAKEYILEKFDENYYSPWVSKEEGAHEAIRPTALMDAQELQSFCFLRNIQLTNKHFKLYDLIFKRFIQSCLVPAIVKEEEFEILGKNFKFLTEIVEHGIDLVRALDLVKISEGEYDFESQIFKKSKYTPYTYAEIIELMKERWIWRPSTYAITIEKLLERKYVIEKNGYLFARKLGFRVIKELENSAYKKFVQEEFTANLEKIMDEVEAGKVDYKVVLEKLYREIVKTE